MASPRPAFRSETAATTLSAAAILVGEEHVVLRKLPEQVGRLTEIGGQHIGGVARNPLRQVDRLIDPGVEPDQDAGLCITHILD